MLDVTILKAFERCRSLPAIVSIFERLRRDLPSSLLYHSCSHSEDVFVEAIRFAVIGGVGAREVELVALAAAFHDAGFLTQRAENEPIAAELAHSEMHKSSSYDSAECALVRQMILDTALISTPQGLKQHASTSLSGYLLDADLSNLGRLDFFDKGELQLRETTSDQASFWERTLSLIEGHTWKTPAARAMRTTMQCRNIALLRKRLGT